LKIALNLRPIDGPFGGGNSFVSLLAEGLQARGHSVVFNLSDDDIDLILILDPRWRHPLRSFSIPSVVLYLLRHREVLIVHRINECDERKGSKTMNRKLRRVNYVADATIFVGSWLKNLNLTYTLKKGIRSKNCEKVILNGSNKEMFFPDLENDWNPTEKMKIVTHHWSGNYLKGAELYLELDNLIDDSSVSNQFEFTYIGNWEFTRKLKNSRHIQPLHGQELAQELRSNHVYITGSLNEPGGNHQNEGMLSGLPVIYVQSGCLPEYCGGFGIELNDSISLKSALKELLREYSSLRKKVLNYPRDSEKMIDEYELFFSELLSRRNDLVSQRKYRRSIVDFLKLLIPM
jgi:hypothetical protein